MTSRAGGLAAARGQAGHGGSLLKRVKRQAVRGFLSGTFVGGIWTLARAMSPSAVDVLLHHRIADPRDRNFFGFKGNISATPAMFARQLDYLARHHTVIDLATFEAAVCANGPLPPNPVLITFDDGYADNLEVALPQLSRRGMPAVLFLATGYVADRKAFVWDAVADAMARTRVTSASLPLIGATSLATDTERGCAALSWITAAKRITAAEQHRLLQSLAGALDVELAERPPPRTHVDWQDIARMAAAGVAICPHTVTHPILSRVPLDQARDEIAHSWAEIEQRLGYRARTFAYPNGTASDFGPDHERLLDEQGFRIAFRSDGGRAFLTESRRRRFAVRRIGISARDDVARFAAKLAGLSRFTAV